MRFLTELGVELRRVDFLFRFNFCILKKTVVPRSGCQVVALLRCLGFNGHLPSGDKSLEMVAKTQELSPNFIPPILLY